MANPVISAIVPIYNVEEYLSECLESILSQTFNNIELICVNDGSTDDSLAIMEEYAKRDSRVVVIDKENGGYGAAINCGLDRSRGQWVSIIESDDFIEPTMFEDMIELAGFGDEAPKDIIKSSYWLYFDSGENGQSERSYVSVPPLSNVMPSCISEVDIKKDCSILFDHPSIWTALYRRDFLDSHGIRMRELPGAAWADNPWFYETILQAGSIIWTPTPYYYYRQTNPNASSNLRDYKLPFERLNDLWGIINRLNITDRNILASFYRRTMMYIAIVVSDHGFPEADPELRSLIEESLDRIDEDVLFAPGKELSKWHIDYYRDFMGLNVQSLKPRDAESNPELSIIIPLGNDRPIIWITIRSILKIKGVGIEVLFIPYNNSDRSIEIAKNVSAVDRRFITFGSVVDSLADACLLGLDSAKGRYVQIMQPGMRYSDSMVLSKIVGQLSKSQSSEIALFATHITWQSQNTEDIEDDEGFLRVLAVGRRAELCLLTGLDVFSKVYSREFLMKNRAAFDNPVEFGFAVPWIYTMLQAEQVTLVSNCAIVKRPYEKRLNARVSGAEELIASYGQCMEALRALRDCGYGDEIQQVCDACMLRLLAEGVHKIDLNGCGERYFVELGVLFDKFFADFQPLCRTYNNYRQYLWLTQVFAGGYERFVMSELRYNRNACNDANVRLHDCNVRLQTSKKKVEKSQLELKAAKGEIKNLHEKTLGGTLRKGKRALHRLIKQS